MSLTIAALVAQAIALLGGHRFPGLTLAVVALLDCALLVVSPGNSTGSLGTVLAVYGTRRELDRGRAFVWIGPLAAISVAAAVIAGPDAGIDGTWIVPFGIARVVLLFGIPVLLAEVAVSRVQLIEALRQRAELAEREQTATARHMVQQQRTQMARELHDIAAHHLTGIIVSAQAAGALADRDRPEQRRYLAALQADAREALDHLRQTVGLLRSDDGDRVLPAPGIDDLPRVVQEAAHRGTPVDFDTVGEPGTIGPVAGVVVIRGVQKALANARKHAPHAPVTVIALWSSVELRVAIENGSTTATPLAIPASGYGLAGLRERLMLVGGTLDAGPTRTGWQTTLTLPTTTAPSADKDEHP
ncbi:sensor histidine kinase [Arthrobacter sp. NPDC092385]|uniref:sensor histidine kinase n=1 Tax=Arthrobacter sp. NPDC092385 TaxID=3363943 RepID=UPI0038271DEC